MDHIYISIIYRCFWIIYPLILTFPWPGEISGGDAADKGWASMIASWWTKKGGVNGRKMAGATGTLTGKWMRKWMDWKNFDESSWFLPYFLLDVKADRYLNLPLEAQIRSFQSHPKEPRGFYCFNVAQGVKKFSGAHFHMYIFWFRSIPMIFVGIFVLSDYIDFFTGVFHFDWI